MKKVFLVMSFITAFGIKASAQPYVHVTVQPTVCQTVNAVIYPFDVSTCGLIAWKTDINAIPGNGTTTLDLGIGANWHQGTTPSGTWLTDWSIEEVHVRNTCSQSISFGPNGCGGTEYDVARLGVPINSCSGFPINTCYEVTAGNTCNGCVAGDFVNVNITYVAPDDIYIDVY